MKKQPATKFGLTAKQVSEYLGCNVPVADGIRILRVMEKSPKGLTCEECMLALGAISRTTGTSRRFYTLWQAGCLTKTSQRRPTKSGGLAQVYVLSPKASFSSYLAALHRKPKGGEPSDQNAVDTFRKQWARCKSRAGKEKAIAALIQSLLSKE